MAYFSFLYQRKLFSVGHYSGRLYIFIGEQFGKLGRLVIERKNVC